MDKLQELFDEASTGQLTAKQHGKASGLIHACNIVIVLVTVIVGLSFFLSDSYATPNEIEEVIAPTYNIILVASTALFLFVLSLIFFSKEEPLNLERIKNDGIKEIKINEYTKHYYRSFFGGISASAILFALTFYHFWHIFLGAFQSFEYSNVFFFIYRFLYLALLVFVFIKLVKVDKKYGYSREWVTESERTRPRL